MDTITIALVEDEVMFRKGISYLLNHEGYTVVFEGNNGLEVINYLENCTQLPDIILMDIKMPEQDGVTTTKIITQQYPQTKVVILSTYDSETFIVNILNLGAAGYISKKETPDELLTKINQVAQNGFYYKQFMLEYIYKDVKPIKKNVNNEIFSSRELEVLQLICKQYSATEIAQQLFISPRTVDGHRNSLLEKTNSKNIIGLVLYALKNNLAIFD